MTLEAWILLTVTSFISAVIPGPSCLLGLNHGILFGKRKSTATALGVSVAAIAMAFVSLLGLGVILETSGVVFTFVKYIGAAYLVYLGIKAWRAPVEEYNEDKEKYNRTKSSYLKLFIQGLLVGLSNPKAIIFFAALFSQFIDSTANSTNQYLIILITIYGVAFTSVMLYAVGGQFISPYLKKIKFRKVLNKITGSTFLGFGTAIVVSE